MAGRDLGGGRHYRHHGLGHVLVEVHDVVGRHLSQFAGAPRLQRMRPVATPIRALVMEIAAHKGVDALRTAPHVRIGRPGRIIPLVVLARPVELGQCRVDVVARRGIRWRRVGGVEGQCRRTGEWRAHQGDRAEYVGPHQRAPRRDRRAEIVADDRGDHRIAECRDQPQRIPNRIQQPEGVEVAVVIGVPAGAAAITPLVGGEDMKAGSGEWQHDFAP